MVSPSSETQTVSPGKAAMGFKSLSHHGTKACTLTGADTTTSAPRLRGSWTAVRR
jgi:hypothetical protein